ncbi:hypothetical protein Psuf_085880 [Phytohabitans suffuscus]|uniref:Uncharacterized protein n=1 Tax=Phytohabitans suffuscus TaxID=624315 RepID=A0A6F8YYM7_9ACTN|nr:hypothetical protein Psuf_085880 [Phytohabitans suffuscus]
MDVRGVAGEEEPPGAVRGGRAQVQPEVGQPHRVAQPYRAAGVVVGEGLQLVEARRVRCGRGQHHQEAPGGRLFEGKEEQRPARGEVHVRRAPLHAVRLQVGQRERLRVRAPGELDPGQPPYRAVRAVAADHVPRAYRLLPPVRPAQRALHAVGRLGEAGERDAAPYLDTGRGEVLGEDPLGPRLGQD